MCIYIRNDHHWQERPDLQTDGIEALWLEVFFEKSKSILLCTLYWPPNSSKHLTNNFEPKFDDMVSTAVSDGKEVIITGDLNCDYLLPSKHKTIKNCLKLNGLKQVINQSTRITPEQCWKIVCLGMMTARRRQRR